MNAATIKNYSQALAYLGGKKERPYAHNTRIEIDTLNMGHEVITIKYHGNPVVNMFPNGVNTYSSCGWKTSTTKERINWFLPEGFVLSQDRSVWYISDRRNGWESAKRFVFADGIAIDASGNVYNHAGDDAEAEVKKTLKAIKKYVTGYVLNLLSGEMDAPSASDCWYCFMVTPDGENLLDATKNTDHILSHFEESYYVPFLLVVAAKFKERMSTVSKDGVARLWQGESISDWQASIVARDVRSTLTAYLKHLLEVAA
jgi:hypothetical protein